MVEADIDHLVLGCTHYPYLIPVLREILPAHVKIIDCGEAVARQTERMLTRHNLQTANKNMGRHEFYNNTDPAILKDFLKDSEAEMTISFLDF